MSLHACALECVWSYLSIVNVHVSLVCVCLCVCVSECGGGPAVLQGAAVLLVGRWAVTNPGRLLIGRQPVLRKQLTLPANTQGTQRLTHTLDEFYTYINTQELQLFTTFIIYYKMALAHRQWNIMYCQILCRVHCHLPCWGHELLSAPISFFVLFSLSVEYQESAEAERSPSKIY